MGVHQVGACRAPSSTCRVSPSCPYGACAGRAPDREPVKLECDHGDDARGGGSHQALTPTTTALEQVLAGYHGMVWSVAVTAYGTRAVSSAWDRHAAGVGPGHQERDRRLDRGPRRYRLFRTIRPAPQDRDGGRAAFSRRPQSGRISSRPPPEAAAPAPRRRKSRRTQLSSAGAVGSRSGRRPSPGGCVKA